MRCPNCKSEHIIEDHSMNCWSCEDCSSIFEQPLYEKRVNIFLSVLVNIFLIIPIFGFVLASIIGHTKIKEEYKSSFLATTIVVHTIYMLLVLYFALVVRDRREIYALMSKENAIAMAAEHFVEYEYLVDVAKEYENIVPEIDAKVDTEIEPKVVEKIVYVEPDDILTLDMLHNAVISGASIIKYMEAFPDNAVILQTAKMREKYGSEYYANYGPLLSICEIAEDSYSITPSLKHQYIKQINALTASYVGEDAGDIEGLYNKKNITYIFENRRYESYCVYDEDDKVIGMLFIEQKTDKEIKSENSSES